MEIVQAKTFIECYVECPYCECYQNRFDDLREYFEDGFPSAENIEVEIICEECEVMFVVEQINY